MEEKNYATVESLTAQADEQYLKYLSEGRLRDILKVMGLMPDYTVMNDVLIMSQMPNVKLVKRLTGWNKDGRKVKEHQKSLVLVLKNTIKITLMRMVMCSQKVLKNLI